MNAIHTRPSRLLRTVRPTDFTKAFTVTPALINAGYQPPLTLMVREKFLPKEVLVPPPELTVAGNP